MAYAKMLFNWIWIFIFHVVFTKVYLVKGCLLKLKLPLGIYGYPPQDYTSLQFSVGDIVKFRCVTGQEQITYNLTGSPKIQCLPGNKWTSKPPRCKATTCSPSPPIVQNGLLVSELVAGKTNKIGSMVRYNCTVGFSSPNLIKVCQKDGYWKGNVNCSRTLCPKPVLSNGHVDYTQTLVYHSVARYTCRKGYILNGPSIRFCNKYGHWSGVNPQCLKMCPKLDDHGHGQLNGHFEPAQQSYQPGQRVTFKCTSSRYVVKGSEIKTCLQDGSWSGSSTKCVINQCIAVSDFRHGSVLYSQDPYTIGTEVKFTCYTGFKLVGPSNRFCQKNGMWSELSNPKCQELSCGEPGVISNGYHDPIHPHGGYEYGSTVRYKCKGQFVLWGNATLKCTSYDLSPYWTHESPECVTLAQFNSRCNKKGGHLLKNDITHPKCMLQNTLPPAIRGHQSNQKLDTLTIVTATAGSTIGALVILLSIMVFVRRFQRNRRFRHHNVRSRFYSDDDHVTLITCPRGYHFALPSYDEAMSQVQRDPPPFDTVVQDNTTTVINNNINITMPGDESTNQLGANRMNDRTILQVSTDQQVNIVNNPIPNSSHGALVSNSTACQTQHSSRNSVSSQESLQISETPSISISEDDLSINNESQPLIGS